MSDASRQATPVITGEHLQEPGRMYASLTDQVFTDTPATVVSLGQESDRAGSSPSPFDSLPLRQTLAAVSMAAAFAVGVAQPAGAGSEPKRYPVRSDTAQDKIYKLNTTCMPRPPLVYPGMGIKGTSKKRKEISLRWVVSNQDKEIDQRKQKFVWKYKQQGRLAVCGLLAYDNDGKVFFPNPSRLTRAGGHLSDRYTLDKPQSISKFVLFLKPKKK